MTSKDSIPNGTLVPSSTNNQSSFTTLAKIKLLTDGYATLTNGDLTGLINLSTENMTVNNLTVNNIVIDNITFPNLDASRALILDSNKNLDTSITTDIELSYVHGVTSSIQDQLDAKINTINILGTANEIDTQISGNDVIISLADNPIFPGSGSIVWPTGNTSQRSGIAGATRFNNQTMVFEGTVDGSNWDTFTSTSTSITSVTASTPLSSSGGNNPNISISGSALTKVDDTNVTLTLGGTPNTSLLAATSITAGWTGTLASSRGGTGVNNGSNTLTLGGSLTTLGAFASTFTMTGPTSVTFPTSGTLATTTSSVSSVTGTLNRITSSGGTAPVIDISASYVGQSSITTLGTITSGVWNGTTIPVTSGGTGLTTIAQGDLIYASAANTITTLAKNTTASRYLANTGTSNNPNWDQVNLANGVTGTLPIANGGTGVTSVTTAPTANAFAGWNANSNLSANNHIQGYATTATTAGTTILTVSSPFLQFFTGATTQTIRMPVASTCVLGQQWCIVNSTLPPPNDPPLVITIQSSGSNTITTLSAGSQVVVTCILTSGTTAASWSYIFNTTGSTSVNGTFGYYKTSGAVGATIFQWGFFNAGSTTNAQPVLLGLTYPNNHLIFLVNQRTGPLPYAMANFGSGVIDTSYGYIYNTSGLAMQFTWFSIGN